MLWAEHGVYFEDYCRTVFSHRVLIEDDYKYAKMIEEADLDLQKFFTDHFIDSD